MYNPNRDYNNSFDGMFDFDHDGKIDSLEQFAEIDYLSRGRLTPGDGRMEVAHDYFMNSDDPELSFPDSLAEDYDEDEDDDMSDDDY